MQRFNFYTLLLLCFYFLTGCEVDSFCFDCFTNLRDAEVLFDPISDAAFPVDADEARDVKVDVSDAESDADEPFPCSVERQEICNQRDDNCDGLTDEGFDLMNDPRNCGSCGHACQFDNAESICKGGKCAQSSCLSGFADLDPDQAGCEYRCPVYPMLGEQCNGMDDDCDGLIDEEEELPDPPASLCKRLEGTPCEGTVAICDTREGISTWYCDYPEEVSFDPSIPDGIAQEESLCDGIDEDCDGVVDEVFPNLGNACSRGIGGCADRGELVCNDSMDDVVCSAVEIIKGSAEICNGIDDDCDGEVDEDGFGEMVEVSDGGDLSFFIDRYEASQPIDHTYLYSCSVPNAQPWVNVSWQDAKTACEEANKRLCSEEEWELACAGLLQNTYPYGNEYDPQACNGVEYDPDCDDEQDDDAIQNTGTAYGCPSPPAQSHCVSDYNVYDMSGNVREWTDTLVPDTTNTYRIRGGSIYSSAPGLTCQFDFGLATADFFFENLGFRCCSDVAL